MVLTINIHGYTGNGKTVLSLNKNKNKQKKPRTKQTKDFQLI